MYTAIEYFTDLKDGSYAYKVGDEYPRKGYTPSEERIKELSGKNNARKRPVIAAVKEKPAKEAPVEETPAEEAPVEEKPKKRSRKKSDD